MTAIASFRVLTGCKHPILEMYEIPEKIEAEEYGAKKKYNDDFPLLAEGYARQGLTDEQIAHNLGISHDTFYRYQKEYPEFREAIQRGKRPVDIEVENELLRLCLGFESTDRVTEFYPPSQDGSVRRSKIHEAYQKTCCR